MTDCGRERGGGGGVTIRTGLRFTMMHVAAGASETPRPTPAAAASLRISLVSLRVSPVTL